MWTRFGQSFQVPWFPCIASSHLQLSSVLRPGTDASDSNSCPWYNPHLQHAKHCFHRSHILPRWSPVTLHGTDRDPLHHSRPGLIPSFCVLVSVYKWPLLIPFSTVTSTNGPGHRNTFPIIQHWVAFEWFHILEAPQANSFKGKQKAGCSLRVKTQERQAGISPVISLHIQWPWKRWNLTNCMGTWWKVFPWLTGRKESAGGRMGSEVFIWKLFSTIKALVHLHFYAHIKTRMKSLGWGQLTIPLSWVYFTCNPQSSVIIPQIIK